MNLSNNVKVILIGLGCIVFSMGLPAQEKKNLLFIITDQQRYDALSIAGNPVIKTPNLDRLAKKGAYFTNAYTPCAVCGPARSSILTGSRVETTGVKSNGETYHYNGREVMTMQTFDEVLAQNGYHCEYYGKWHAMTKRAEVYENPLLTAAGDKSVFGPGGQAHAWRDYLATLGRIPEPEDGQFIEDISKYPYVANPLDRFYGMSSEDLTVQGLKHSQPDQHGQLLLDTAHTMTAFQASQTIDAIERLKDKTFSITCSFHFPHSPMTVPEPYYSMYPPEDMPLPASLHDEMENSPYANANGRTRRIEYADPDKIKYMISEYYGIITEIDHWVGRVLGKLEELGIADNTLIIFTSDHGEMLGAHGMREKNVFLEESAHIPLFISSPNDIQAETIVDSYVSLVDLYPTILDYLNVPGPASDGKSLKGLIEGTDKEHGQFVVTEWDRENTPNYMVIKDGWKLIIPYTIQSDVINSMYDLNADPHEMNNLLGNNPNRADFIEKAEELRSCLLEWLAERNSIHYYSVSQRDLLNGGHPTGNDAEFLFKNFPDAKGGESIDVEIVMKNTGVTSWSRGANFKLDICSGNGELLNFNEVELAEGEVITPGAEKTFKFEITLPDFDGAFTLQWQMKQEGEEWFGEKTEAVQLIFGQALTYLDDCDDLTGWKSSQALELDSESQKQGLGCLKFKGTGTDEYKKTFSQPFELGAEPDNGVLQFWYYVSDPTLIETNNQVELGSSGKADENEYSWKLKNLSEGWNFISLDIEQANKNGTPDLKAINWFRLYSKKTGSVITKIDGIWLGEKNKTGISNMDDGLVKGGVIVTPNPVVDDDFYLRLTGFDNGSDLDINIYDVYGQLVFRKRTFNSTYLNLAGSGLKKNATYFVTILSKRVFASTKFVTL